LKRTHNNSFKADVGASPPPFKPMLDRHATGVKIKEMISIEEIKNFYKNNPLHLTDENIDFDLLDLFVKSRNEIDDFVVDVINHGNIKKQVSVKLNYEDSIETQFVLIEKNISEMNISLIIKINNEKSFQIISLYPTIKTGSSYKNG